MIKNQLEKAYSNLVLDTDFIKLELLYQKPNIFSALKLAHHEIRHSNFLGWLLDPSQTHGLGIKFLKLVLFDILHDERVNDISVTSIGNLNLDKAVVWREWKNIDILIKIEDLVITIENKVLSGESKHQLKKYKDSISKEFGKSKQVFVFLTPNGFESSLNDDYVNYSYERIIWILEVITTAYKEAISPSVMVYLNDYIETLKTKFMANGEINKLARQVYINHKDLFDFILNNTPNPLKEFQDYFDNKVQGYGWKKQTCQKNYVRFLTPKLLDIVPRNSTTWKGEAFLFEFFIKNSELAFYFTIGPGDKVTRDILQNSLSNFVIDSEIYPTNEYICYSYIFKEIEDAALYSNDKAMLDAYLKDFWVDVIKAVNQAEEAILKQKDKLLKINI